MQGTRPGVEFGARFAFARRWRREPATLAEMLAEWRKHVVTKKWWPRATARRREDRWRLPEADRRALGRPVATLRLPPCGRRAHRCARFYAERAPAAERRQLRGSAARHRAAVARGRRGPRALQAKYRWFFIDEFQDTDPIQAEIFLLLAADEREGEGEPAARPRRRRPAPGTGLVVRRSRLVSNAGGHAERLDWTTVPLRPGALFVVGDPKQSIYRFRRADIDIYTCVHERIRACGGEVLHLTANWRSLPGVCALANDVFPGLFPTNATRESPTFERLAPMRPETDAARGPSVARLVIPAKYEKRLSWRARRSHRARHRRRGSLGRRRYGSFLVLTRNRPRLEHYADALDALHIPVEVSGAGRFGGSRGRRAGAAAPGAADPLDGLALAGVLRGPLFGVSDPELFRFAAPGGGSSWRHRSWARWRWHVSRPRE